MALRELPTFRCGGRLLPEPPDSPAVTQGPLPLRCHRGAPLSAASSAIHDSTFSANSPIQHEHSLGSLHHQKTPLVFGPPRIIGSSAHTLQQRKIPFSFKCVSAELKSTEATEAHLHTIKGGFLRVSEPPCIHQAWKGGVGSAESEQKQ